MITPKPISLYDHTAYATAMMAREYGHTAVLALAVEGGFVVIFSVSPGLSTKCNSLEHARVMATKALRVLPESLTKERLLQPTEAPRPSVPLIGKNVAAVRMRLRHPCHLSESIFQ